jgi:hypothetical protein
VRHALTIYMQAILITSSLLLVAAMLGSLWLAALRSRTTAQAAPGETADDTV